MAGVPWCEDVFDFPLRSQASSSSTHSPVPSTPSCGESSRCAVLAVDEDMSIPSSGGV